MKNYHSLLLAKAAVCFLLIAQPSQAVNPSETDLSLALPLMTEDKVVDEPKIATEKVISGDIERDLEKDSDILKSDSQAVKIRGLDRPSLGVAPKIAQSYNPSGGMPAPPNGVMVPNPEIIIKSNGTPNPTIIQPTTPALPVLPRAVAPPVGDMSISNINASPAILDLGPAGNTIIPRLVLRKAPADEVLKVLARYAGVNLVSIDSTGSEGADPAKVAAPTSGTTDSSSSSGNANISLDIQNEPVQNVFNSVLMASGLKASRRGNTIFVGKRLPDEARNTVTRTLRLNQAKAEQVAIFLASQGAEVNLLLRKQAAIKLPVTTIDPLTGQIKIEKQEVTQEKQATEKEELKTELTKIEPGISNDPKKISDASFILKGLLVGTDSRLNIITLVGDTRQVEVATSLIVQMDARRRQVSINVKVVDINLTDSQQQSIDFKFGDGGNYGLNQLNNFGPVQSTVLNFGNGVGIGSLLPNATSFSATIQYAINSGNAKVLTDPTLVVQEGQIANVAIVQKVLSGSTTTVVTGANGGSNSYLVQPTFEFVGLTLGINVESIDDNGFISIVVKPAISAPSGTVEFNSGSGGTNNTFTLITKREVDSGLVRLRDGQTLILSGIISQQDRSTVTKVPILGDIPFLGVLFRSQEDSTQRSEVVVMLTPHILNEGANSQFGSNFTPSKAASEMLKENNFPAQAQP